MKSLKFVISLFTFIFISVNLCNAQEKKTSFWDKAKQKVEKAAKQVEKTIEETLQTPIVTPKSPKNKTQSQTNDERQESNSLDGNNLSNLNSNGNQQLVAIKDYEKEVNSLKQLLDQKLKQRIISADLIYLEHLESLIKIGYGERNYKEESIYMEEILRKIQFGNLPNKKIKDFISISESIGMSYMKIPNYEKASIYLRLLPQGISSYSEDDQLYISADIAHSPSQIREKKLERVQNELDLNYLLKGDNSSKVVKIYQEDAILQKNIRALMYKSSGFSEPSGVNGQVFGELTEFGINKADEQKKISNRLKEMLSFLDSFNVVLSPKISENKAEYLIKTSIEKFDPSVLQDYSELDQTFIITKLNEVFHANLSYIATHIDKNPNLSILAYNQTLQLHSILLARQMKIREHIRLNNNKETRKLYQEWLNQRLVLSQKTGSDFIKVREKCDSLEILLNKAANINLKKETIATWSDIKKKLSKEEATIEFIRFPFKGSTTLNYAVLILRYDSDKPKFILLKNGNELEGSLFKKYQISRTEESIDNSVYDNYWSSIQKNLEGVKRVYVASDGIYHQINLNTLKPLYGSNKYLMDDLEINLVNSTRDIINYEKQNNKILKLNAVLFGNPHYDLEENERSTDTITSVVFRSKSEKSNFAEIRWESLPETEKEIKNIANILDKKGYKVNTYTQSLATESNIKKLNKIDILHIATHGYFSPFDFNGFMDNVEKDARGKNDSLRELALKRLGTFLTDSLGIKYSDQTLNSGLVLAGSNSKSKKKNLEDGLLTAYEVTGIDLENTNLVVLSACETGLGEVKNGQGVYGLQRAFQVAGAKSLIMSLWKVRDDVTQDFMTRFYLNWLEKGLTKKEAFRKTQLEIKNVYPEIYLWGGFIMLGL